MDRSRKIASPGRAARTVPLGIRLVQATAAAGFLMVLGVGVARYYWGLQTTADLSAAVLSSSASQLGPAQTAVSVQPSVSLSALSEAARSAVLRGSHLAANQTGELDKLPWSAETAARLSDLPQLNRIALQFLSQSQSNATTGHIETSGNWPSVTASAKQFETLGKVLIYSALASNTQKQQALSLQYLSAALFLTDRLTTHPDPQTVQTAISLRLGIFDALVHISTALRYDSTPGSPSPAAAKALLNQLQYDSAWLSSYRQALLDRQAAVMAQSTDQGSPTQQSASQWLESASNSLLLPLRQRQTLKEVLTLEGLYQATSQSTLARAHSAIAPEAKSGLEPQDLNGLKQQITDIYLALAHQRLAAVALATSLYAHEHGGAPLSLAQLSPTFLVSTPADPLAADGSPLTYRTHPTPVVISAGTDGLAPPASSAPNPLTDIIIPLTPPSTPTLSPSPSPALTPASPAASPTSSATPPASSVPPASPSATPSVPPAALVPTPAIRPSPTTSISPASPASQPAGL